MIYSSNEETEAQTEEHGGQNRTKDSGLDDKELVFGKQNHEEDDLDDGANRRLNEHTDHMRNFASELLAGESDQVGTGSHGDVGKSENENMLFRQSI